MKKTILSLLLSLVISGSAFAHDSSHYVCTGFTGGGGGKYGFMILFDESRATDGVSREEMLSTVWAGTLYQGTRVNENDAFGQNGQVTLSDKSHPSQVFYRGKYELIQMPTGDGYSFKVDGQINLTPTDRSSLPTPISTTLNCVDITT